MKTFNVLLDTNIFINAKYNFTRASLDNLKKYCDDGIVSMFTNDIIIREVKHHIENDVGLLAAQAKNAIKNHGELINAISPIEFESIKDTLLDAPKKLTAAFCSFMDNATILSNTGLSIVDLFNDYFAPNAPFEGCKEKKSEFPDATVIMSIKRYLSSIGNVSLHVITNDDGWHNALKDIRGVVMYKEIKFLLTEISKEREGLYKSIVLFIGEKIASLQEQAENWLLDQEWEFAVEEVDVCIECDEVDEVDVRDVNLILDGIEYIDNSENYAVATLSGIAKINVGFSYIDHGAETYDREDHGWYNTAYGDGMAKIEAPISLSVTVMLPDEGEEFDLDLIEFNDLDKRNTEIIEYQLTEHNDDLREPFYNICPDCGREIGLHNDGGNGFCIDCAHKH